LKLLECGKQQAAPFILRSCCQANGAARGAAAAWAPSHHPHWVLRASEPHETLAKYAVSERRSAVMSATPEATATRPFRIEVPEEQLAELLRRLAATRWPSRELVADRSQGVQLATIQALARYWAKETS
jgi:Epoxide hydrolase N terminus